MELFQRYPYLLPCIVVSFLQASTVIGLIFFMEEPKHPWQRCKKPTSKERSFVRTTSDRAEVSSASTVTDSLHEVLTYRLLYYHIICLPVR